MDYYAKHNNNALMPTFMMKYIFIHSHSFRFDVMVNGGGAITLQFQRSPFRPMTRTVFVPWNQVNDLAL
jgi:hypothetical protein